MSSDLRALYQEVILDHYKHPRNYGILEGADKAEGYNPLCGDRVAVYVKKGDGKIEGVSFEGSGCAISTASASLMTEAVSGMSVDEAHALQRSFHGLVTGQEEEAGSAEIDLGKLEVLAGVRDYPVRIKCATLAWHALKAALEHQDQTVTTE